MSSSQNVFVFAPLLLFLAATVLFNRQVSGSSRNNRRPSGGGYNNPFKSNSWENDLVRWDSADEVFCRQNRTSHEDTIRTTTSDETGRNRSRVEVGGEILKRHVHLLRKTTNRKVELVFLVDSSASVGSEEFLNELKFVKKLLADFTVDRHTTRVSVITFSSKSRVVKHIDHMTHPKDDNHKCSLLEEELPKIEYTGGGTHTIGALIEAQSVFRHARPDAKKALFLITDGYSNGGDPLPEAEKLKRMGVEIFTFGIREGNFRELCDMASSKKEEHTYILNTFEEFEVLARRALHEDLHVGNYVIQNSNKCNSLCEERKDCCDSRATCRCGTHTGKYECVCQAGYYGSGVKDGCMTCPEGTYKNYTGPGDKSTCIACPDPNQSSPLGSVNIDQCHCRKGFRAIGPHACAAKTCPDLTPPENGYFVQGQCSNDVNAACGMRCKSGYTMHGTSLRLCTEEGMWTGNPVTCEVKLCPKLLEPPNGQMACTKNDSSFDTHCHFHCDAGYRLVGSKSQSCLAIALWSGIHPKCREIKCPELKNITDARVSAESCTTRESSYGTICTFVCHPGYKMTGHHSKQCMESGKWAPEDGTENQCVDITPPMITCPNNITVNASADENFGTVTWELPAVSDNSLYLPSVTVLPTYVPPVQIPIGENLIMYIAEDGNKNKAKCTFAVIVRDTQRPRVDKCISPPPFMGGHGAMNITWEEPIFSDNSFQPVKITRSRDPGVFPLGTTSVTYTATDKNGNTVTCDIKITIQEHACANHPVPLNGNLTCNPQDTGLTCYPTCRDGYGFAIQPSDKYFCDYRTGLWKPEEKWPIKDCSISRKSNHAKQTVEMQFKLKSQCQDRLILNHLENNIEKKIKQKAVHYCLPNMACDAGQFETTCIDEDAMNRINVLGQSGNHGNAALEAFETGMRERVRRDAGNFERRFGVEYQRHGSSLSVDVKSTITVKYDINGSSVVSEDRGAVDIRSGVTLVREKIIKDAVNGDFDSIFRDEGTEVTAFDHDSRPPEFLCHPGSVLIDLKCVNCPGGTFFNVINEACVGCQRGTYQPEEGQLTCLVCPNNMSTSQNNSRSIQQCRGQCLPGSFSEDGVEWCETCPIGSYQPSYAQTTCLPCADGTKTWRRGSRRREDCGVECREGLVSKTGLEPCFPCPRGYFQPERGKSSCFVCPEGVRTRSTGSTDITDCEGISQMAASANILSNRSLSITDCFSEPCQNGAHCVSFTAGYTCECLSGWTGLHCEMEIDECLSNPCLNNGSCVDEMSGYTCIDCSPGYSGSHCELNIDECESGPCENNATCVDYVNSYRCDCAAGFNGTLCEENIDDCIDMPCKNNGTCVDEVTEYRCQCAPGFQGTTCEVDIDECTSGPCQNNGNCTDDINAFRCGCKSGYTGTVCETDIDECLSTPCQNDATCLDMEGRYLCRCAPSFTGVDCETKLNSSFDFYFPTSGITDYASIEDPFGKRNLTAFTLAMWLRTDDRENQGTPVSYATDADSNALVITDYSGFVLYVNGKIQHTDVTADDGNWHHIATTWSSEKGAWQVFKDGVKVTSGTGMVPDTAIEGGGVLVVGQEQDARGGMYSISESFIGNLSRINLWDYVLTDQDVSRIASSCDENIGNLVAWPDFLSGANGRIERINSHLCRGCEKPVNISSGSVQWTGTEINDTASYSCASGYELDGPSNKTCLLNSSWSGIEVRCIKVSCGPPPDIQFGDPSYFYSTYGNTAEYICLHGYDLVGNKSVYCNASGQWEGQVPTCVEITCTLSPLTTGLRLLNTKSIYRFEESARFDCQAGYRLASANRNMKCTRSGQWDNAMPRCDRVICDPVPSILNGRVLVEAAGNDTFFHPGQYLGYTCDVGYEPVVADSRLRCGDSGAWASTHRNVKVSCQMITCIRPSRPKNGWLDAPSYSPVFNSTAVYRCDDGYVRFGPAERRCQSNGTWTGVDPTCQVITCPRPGEILHGRMTGSDFSYRGKIAYTCDEGYELSGATERTCGSGGTWSSPEPTCRPVECPRPGNITHGHVIGDAFTYESVVDFTCESGFQLAGAKQQRCLANGTWSDLTPTCVKVLCASPIEIPNGRHKGSVYETGSVIMYTCDKGYEIEGKDTRTCRLDGTWTGPTPKCNSIHCVFPASIEHGRYQSDQNVLGSTIEYQCDSGYALDGPTNRTCSDDKKWTGTDPSCQELVCERPAGIAHGSVNGDSHRVGSSVFYKCEPGYRLNGSAVRFCVEDTRVWNGTEPNCVAVDCGKPTEAIANGGIMSSNFSYGAVIQYACDNGYYVPGVTTRTCRADGTWSKEVPVCERVECPRPGRGGNTIIQGNEYRYRDKIVYSCTIGYKLVGAAVRVCQADKTWNGTEPRCDQVQCGSPSTIANGRVVTQGYYYKNLALYTCNTKYRLTTDGTRYCTENGTWSGAEPQCLELACGQPPAIANGRALTDSVRAGMTVEYQCNDGYRLLVQSAKLTCSLQGVFAGNPPRCEKVECPAPQPIEFGRLNYTNITMNSVLRYACDLGYALEGPVERICGEDRQWSGVDPYCIVVDCGLPDFIDNAVFHHSGRYDFGATVGYTCNEGFLLKSGDLNRTCLAEKRWSGSPPVCEKIACPRPEVLFGFIASAAGDNRNEQHVQVIDRFVYGMNVEFDCEAGFRLQGERELTCLINGSWNSPIPSCDRISCPNVSVTNGQVLAPKGFKYGFHTLVSCNEGYEISGSKELTCLVNGSWSSEIPTCQPVTCEEPPHIDDMDVKIIASPNSGFGYPFGMTLGFECLAGFELIGATRTTCLATKQWSTPFPQCHQIVCSPPLIEGKSIPILDNPKDTYGLGEMLHFRCAAGYHLDGLKDIACNENRTWNGTIPRCVQSVCPSLQIPHALFNGSVPEAKDLFEIGKTLSISCEDGYSLNGTKLLRCTENRKWNDTAPTCVVVTCLLPEILNSETRSENVRAGMIVWINCKPGYRLAGASPITCQKSGRWSDPLPECIMITCPEFSVPGGNVTLREEARLNGRHRRAPIAPTSRPGSPPVVYKQGQSVVVECNDGFTLNGSSSNGILTCLESGLWSADAPTCEKIFCPAPETVNNSRLEILPLGIEQHYVRGDVELEASPPIYEFGTHIKYVCDNGFKLVGEKESICILDGQWSEKFPKCVLIHCTSLIVPNAVLSTNATSFGTVVNVTCRSGYQMLGEELLTCQGDGKWTSAEPVCFMIACKVPKILFARLLNTTSLPDTAANYGNKIRIECLDGFRMIGQSEVTCGKNNNWMPSLPTCERRHCSLLNLNVTNLQNVISHGVANNESRLPFGTEVKFECALGYLLRGRASIRCDANETWTGQVPNCTRVFCKRPFIENGRVHLGSSKEQLVFGHSIRFSCNPGFRLDGESEMFCQPNGEWTAEFPRCLRLPCPEIPQIRHGAAFGNSTLFEAEVRYQCDTGFDLIGHSTITCLAEQVWSTVPSCQRVKCPAPPSIQNGDYAAGFAFQYESVARYECHQGYELEGQKAITCQSNGQWSGDAPSCHRISCHGPPIVPHADVIGNSYLFRDTLQIRCHEGYRRLGAGIIECLWNETWSKITATCKIVTCGEPPFVRFSSPVFGKLEFNSTVRYACNVGYEIVGNTETTCLANASWTAVNTKCVRIKCSTPVILQNGVLSAEGHEYRNTAELLKHREFYFGDKVVHSCDKGYDLFGISTHTCMSDGRWSATLARCDPVECTRPPGLRNAYYLQSLRNTYTFGQELNVHCEKGYLQKGSGSVVACQYDQTWNTSGILCEKVRCTVPGFFLNGGIKGTDFTYGGQITYACLEGFVLVGERSRTCGANGRWEGAEPHCRKITCPADDAIDNGYIEGRDISYQAVRFYSCRKGYQLIGDARRTCQSDGQWSGRQAECRIVSCGFPEQPDNGYASVNHTTYESVAEHRCDRGYELYGDRYRMCDHNGWWTGFVPTCVMITCIEPPPLPNGRATYEAKSLGSVVTYTCNHRYALMGDGERRCEEDRMWSGEAPACRLMVCPELRVASNVRFYGNDFSVGSTLEFYCGSGYAVTGRKAIVCLQNETWSGPTPSCDRVTCPAPPPLPNAAATTGQYRYGDVVTYACHRGYRMQGDASIACSANGRWSNVTAVCNPVACGDPPPVQNARAVVDGKHFRDRGHYFCNEGYDLHGNNGIQCSAEEVWTGSLPHCELVTCGVVPVIPHASTIVYKTTYGSKASYECNRGYLLRGSSLVECKANGTWTYENRPTCDPVECGDPPAIRNGDVRAPETTFDGIATYFCLEGFKLVGKPVVHCTDAGKWSGAGPSCVPVVCSAPDPVANGYIFGTEHSFGHSVLYTCKTGYTISGNSVRTCQPDGIWSRNAPTCELVYCEAPESPVNGQLNFTGLHFGSEVKYWCSIGYLLSGVETATCESDGNWTSHAPTCIPEPPRKKCLPLPSVKNSVAAPQQFIVGDTVTIECMEGYIPTTSLQVTCQDDLSWSGLQGECEKVTCQASRRDSMVVIHGYKFHYGDRAAYTCRQGLIPVTDPLLTCKADGQWDKTPECRASCKFECRNGGSCVGPNKCKCQQGYGGRFCETAICIFRCLNGGQCVAPYKCECPYGYAGFLCEQPTCAKPCQNGGRCVMANRCLCPHGFVPPFCESSRMAPKDLQRRR